MNFILKLPGLIHSATIRRLFLIVLTSLLVFLIFFGSGIKPAYAAQTWCAIQYLDTSNSTMNSLAISLGETTYSQELCLDASTSLGLFSDKSNKLVSSTGTSIPTGTDPVTYYTQNTWSRGLTDDEREIYWCLLNTQDFGKFSGFADFLASFLPSSPESMRIPTQIQQFFGAGTLAGNLMIELYSAAWQGLLLMALIKFYKLIPFKST